MPRHGRPKKTLLQMAGASRVLGRVLYGVKKKSKTAAEKC